MRAQLEEQMSSSMSENLNVLSHMSRKYLELRNDEEDGPVSERLYAQGMRQRQDRLLAARAAAAVKDPEATFKPRIKPLEGMTHSADPWRKPEAAVRHKAHRTAGWSLEAAWHALMVPGDCITL